MEKQDHKVLKVYKKVVGNLILEFKDFQNMGNSQFITINAAQEFMPVAMGYVLSMFYIPEVLSAYQKGLWSLDKEDKEILVTRAKELGLYFGDESGPDELEQPKILYSPKEVKSLLQRKRVNEIKEIITEGSQEQKNMLIAITKENIMDLDSKTIQFIEEGLKVSITESDM
jgi:hypothetical protein